ncbi:MAG: antibiotic biosynthesis monooxygenase [Methylobacteriaceae bacterium]|nr:antibiotic biosynthesis monooxygenase [Methylobacteriaceae bacterium]
MAERLFGAAGGEGSLREARKVARGEHHGCQAALTIRRVADKESATHVRVFEVYADTEAYRSHLQSPHFLKYKTTTEKMVRSLNLVQTDPIMLGAKAK